LVIFTEGYLPAIFTADPSLRKGWFLGDQQPRSTEQSVNTDLLPPAI